LLDRNAVKNDAMISLIFLFFVALTRCAVIYAHWALDAQNSSAYTTDDVRQLGGFVEGVFCCVENFGLRRAVDICS
jgi:hypothetical protein